MEQILEVRTQLHNYLARFRQGMAESSSRAVTAVWEDEFEADARRIFLEAVEPEIQELRRAMASRMKLMPILEGLLQAGTGGVVGAGLASLFNFHELAAGALVGVGTGAVGVAQRAMQSRERVRGHRMFFYVDAERRLLA
jgi:hypothetical protein